MRILSLIIFITILSTGCKTTTESSNCKPLLAKWLRECTSELAKNQPTETYIFNGVGANDIKFIPKSNPAEEIFNKCKSIRPISAREIPVYKKCLKDCISEIQSINQINTRGEVNKLLRQNGGIFSPQAAIYSHSVCDVLKVRVDFEVRKDENGRTKLSENDKVKAVSMPYLGLFIMD